MLKEQQQVKAFFQASYSLHAMYRGAELTPGLDS